MAEEDTDSAEDIAAEMAAVVDIVQAVQRIVGEDTGLVLVDIE